MTDFSKRVNLEYTLNESEDLETVLEKTNLSEDYKESLRNTAKNIIAAELLIENNPLATEEDFKELEDTKIKYQELKNDLVRE